MSPLPTLRRLLPALALALSTPGLAAATELTLTPYNPGNDAIFQVSSVLVSGQREAILIDAQFGKSQAEQLVALVRATGKTLTYARDGAVWGAEQYLPDRKVVWAFTAEECRTGYWYDENAQICFVYEFRDDPQCWYFYQSATGITARFAEDAEGSPLAEVAQSTGPLGCAGPDLGV